MDRTTATGSSAGLYVDKDDGFGIPGTRIIALDRNAIQEEIVGSIEASGQTPDVNDNAQLKKAILLLTQRGNGFRNQFVNPQFRFNQRAGSPYAINTGAGSVYTLDQWIANAGGPSASINVSRVSASTQLSTTPPGANFALRFQQIISASSPAPFFGQRVSALHRFSGKQISISIYGAFLSGAPQSITPEIRFNYGAGGSATDIVLGSPKPISALFTKATETFTCPSVVGKVIGPGSYLEVRWYMPTNNAHTAEFVIPNFAVGEVDPIPEVRDIALERLLCYAFYQKSYPEDAAPGLVDDSGQIGFEHGPGSNLPTCGRALFPMFGTPTIKWFSPTTGAANKISWGGSDRDVTSTRTTTASFTGNPVPATSPGSISSGSAHFTAEAVL